MQSCNKRSGHPHSRICNTQVLECALVLTLQWARIGPLQAKPFFAAAAMHALSGSFIATRTRCTADLFKAAKLVGSRWVCWHAHLCHFHQQTQLTFSCQLSSQGTLDFPVTFGKVGGQRPNVDDFGPRRHQNQATRWIHNLLICSNFLFFSLLHFGVIPTRPQRNEEMWEKCQKRCHCWAKRTLQQFSPSLEMSSFFATDVCPTQRIDHKTQSVKVDANYKSMTNGCVSGFWCKMGWWLCETLRWMTIACWWLGESIEMCAWFVHAKWHSHRSQCWGNACTVASMRFTWAEIWLIDLRWFLEFWILKQGQCRLKNSNSNRVASRVLWTNTDHGSSKQSI